jgi:hypothetical protein
MIKFQADNNLMKDIEIPPELKYADFLAIELKKANIKYDPSNL